MANSTQKPHRPAWQPLFTVALLAWPTLAPAPVSASDLAHREAQRRNQSVVEAMELLRKGDEAYLDADYRSAVEAFKGARELIPNVPASAELHQAATERYVTASVEHARVLSRGGDIKGATLAIEAVLAPQVAPTHPAALRMQEELLDPIRTNPALNAEHASNVDRVRRTLYTAEGAYNLGKYDEAKKHYQDVLRIDPHNRAANRGMERVASAKSDYYRSAQDQTRAQMLAQVEAEWELQPPSIEEAPEFGDPSTGGPGGDFIPPANKIERIIIPVFNIEQASIQDAIELLRIRARDNDNLELDPARRGLNINLITRGADDDTRSELMARRITLNLNNVNVAGILRYIGEQTATNYTTDDYSVLIRPLATHRDEILTRTFRVPPDFIDALSSASTESSAPADIFAAPETTGLLPKRLGVREALEANGIEFVEGTSASLGNNRLRVTHNAATLEIVEQLVRAAAETEPITVVTRVTVMRIQETVLKELGFDWLLGTVNLGGFGLTGSGGTVGNGMEVLAPSLIASQMSPITAGLRSGSGAINPNAFITGIANSNTLAQDGQTKAPGILSVGAVMNGVTAQLVMRGLDQSGTVDILHQPSVVTRNGQAASVRIMREFIYPTEYEPPELPQNVFSGAGSGIATPATPTAFEMREVGMILEVLPLADASRNYIDLTVAPQFTEFEGFINYGSPITANLQDPITGEPRRIIVTENNILMPVFNTQRVNTQVTVADGATFVLGGYFNSRIENTEDKVPFFGDLPVVGRLFQSKASKNSRTVVMFFVNVELIDPTGRPYRDR